MKNTINLIININLKIKGIVKKDDCYVIYFKNYNE